MIYTSKAHMHHKIESKREIKGWTHCVSSSRCAMNSLRQSAHGGIMYVDHCYCGAIRFAEYNEGRVNFGPWEMPEEKASK